MNNKIDFNKIIITFFGVGLLPIAPGTFGSLAGVLLGIIAFSINNIAIFILIPILFVTGIICSNIHQNKTGKKDDSIIVIDDLRLFGTKGNEDWSNITEQNILKCFNENGT